MRISLVRSGAVAGMRLEVSLDTSVLESNMARRFQRLVEAADLPRLSEPTIRVKTESDHFRYTLTVEDGRLQHSITFEEHRIPEAVRPLIDAVWDSTGSGPGMQTA